MTKRELHHAYGGQILPPTHPVSRHVRRVVSRILSASNLGLLSGEPEARETLFGFDNFGGFGGFSSPDSDFGASAHPSESYGPRKEWDVIVVNDKKTVNAMAAPGVVVVFTGILPVCQDEEGLSAVLAHGELFFSPHDHLRCMLIPGTSEIGHVVARHTAERISSQTIWFLLAFLLQTLGLDHIVSNALTTFVLELPNSRTQEREGTFTSRHQITLTEVYPADLIGLRLMSRACYNPSAAPAYVSRSLVRIPSNPSFARMFERLGRLEKSRRSFEFAQTHPSSESRVQYLEQALPEALQIVAANPECGQYRKQLDAFRETAHGIKVDEIASMLPRPWSR